VEEYDIGKNREMVDQYLELGFNTRGEHLKKNYLVAVTGEQELDGRKTVVIELTQNPTRFASRSRKFRCGWTPAPGWPFNRKFSRQIPRLFHYSLHGINEEFED